VLLTTYFKTRDIAAISICSALWGVLNTILSPVFFQMFGLPILCDLIGFSVLIIAAWWIRKFGAITIIGLISTIINFSLGGGIHFLGFTAASIFFDVATRFIGYNLSFKKPVFTVTSMMGVSIVSAGIAGYVIGTFLMIGPALTSWGGVLGWAGLHMVGGIIGGVIGAFLVVSLTARIVSPNGYMEQRKKGVASK
jgi:hypothetical protein